MSEKCLDSDRGEQKDSTVLFSNLSKHNNNNNNNNNNKQKREQQGTSIHSKCFRLKF
jgi:hypothetical protein